MEGVTEGEDVTLEEYVGPPATTSAARATTTAEVGEDDGKNEIAVDVPPPVTNDTDGDVTMT